MTLGSDLAGDVERTGDGVAQFKPGDKVYGVTNKEPIPAPHADFGAALPWSMGFLRLRSRWRAIMPACRTSGRYSEID
jgi:NADPH:quinone reductase-like Zn-dependent oxidoreductase